MSAETIIATLRIQAQQSWGGKSGEKRADELETFIWTMLADYAEVLGFSEDAILEKLEERRDYAAVNYYQPANFPPLKDVNVFDTVEQLRDKFPSGKFVCPNCGGISTDYSTCNSGRIMANKQPCDWKAWGLLRTFGKGYRFVVKDDFLEHPVVQEVFMPLELHEEPMEAP
ncbi:MAG: hypothetical protein BA864_06915 [Desulfuromonadales bacterium C00003093]|nr:MAG: hypothetical protein BA864_06915 [Desulfuromonadales bacterium C00003093]